MNMHTMDNTPSTCCSYYYDTAAAVSKIPENNHTISNKQIRVSTAAVEHIIYSSISRIYIYVHLA